MSTAETESELDYLRRIAQAYKETAEARGEQLRKTSARPIHLTTAEYEALLRIASHCRHAVAEGKLKDRLVRQALIEWDDAHDAAARADRAVSR